MTHMIHPEAVPQLVLVLLLSHLIQCYPIVCDDSYVDSVYM
jgi:hypothetical protein